MTMMMLDDAEDLHFDVEAEDGWMRRQEEEASRMLLALLERHHAYGTGEMVLPRKFSRAA